MFRPAYIHLSEHRPGIDSGMGWFQDIDVIIRNATPVRLPRKLPGTIADGNLLAGQLEYPNIIPFLLDEFPIDLAIRMIEPREISDYASNPAADDTALKTGHFRGRQVNGGVPSIVGPEKA